MKKTEMLLKNKHIRGDRRWENKNTRQNQKGFWFSGLFVLVAAVREVRSYVKSEWEWTKKKKKKSKKNKNNESKIKEKIWMKKRNWRKEIEEYGQWLLEQRRMLEW